MPATRHVGSDSYAGKIMEVSKSGSFVIFEMNGVGERFNRGKNGTYRKGTMWLELGVAVNYRDPSF